MQKEINFNINLAKTIAICAITFFHINHFYNLNIEAFKYGWIGCSIFFVISGFLNSKETHNNLKVFAKRIFRILPLYYLSLLFWVFSEQNISFSDLAKHILFVFNFDMETFYSINGVFWFCAVLMQIYFLYFLVIKNSIKMKFMPIAYIVGAQVITLFLSKYIGQEPVITKSFLAYLPCFIMGILIKEKRHNEIIMAIFCAIVLLIFNENFIKTKNVFLIEFILAGIFIFLISKVKINFRKKFKKIISYISNASYSIYLFNYTFAFLPFINCKYLNFAIPFLFVIFLGIAIDKIIDKKITSKINLLTD